MSCQICTELYSHTEAAMPRVLTCGHTFCSSCLQRLIELPKRYIQCPNCRNEQRRYPNLDLYPKNYGLLEELDSRKYRQNHSKEIRPINLNISFCPDHPKKPYEFYDETCQKYVCSHCIALGEHNGHKCVSIEDHHSSSECNPPNKCITPLSPSHVAKKIKT